MANTPDSNQLHAKYKKIIESSRFNEAFTSLMKSAERFPQLNGAVSRTRSLENTYKYLLNYMADGHKDAGLPDLKKTIKDNLLSLNDLVKRESKLKDSPDLYSSTKRMELLKNTSLQSRLDEYKAILCADTKNSAQGKKLFSVEQGQATANLFNYVWTMFGADSKDYADLANLFADEELPDYLKHNLISAIILGGTFYFDAEAFSILLDLAEHEEPNKIKALAILGLILISLLYPERIALNTLISSRLMVMVEQPEFKQLVNIVPGLIIRTFDTKRVDSKMRDEVIPGLMKIRPEIMEQMRNMASDSEDFLSNANPDWEEMFEKTGISDKIQEISDMQLEGADVMVTAFSSLKSFPFFYQVSNWFLPVISSHYEFAGNPLMDNESLIEKMKIVMCDSDIYSFLLSIKGIPQERLKMTIDNLNAQMTQASEAMSSSIGETSNSVLIRDIKQSLQDLYRFFKFYKKSSDFNDPFSTPFTGEELSPLITILGIEINTVKMMAEFYFKHKYYEAAILTFRLFDQLQPGEYEVWEKIGFSYEKLKDYKNALDWYRKADFINPGSVWLDKKLAIALKNTGMPQEATQYYKKALEKEPDNFHLLMSYGQCLLDSGEYEEALQNFYHADYIKPERKEVKRAIAWTLLLSMELDKAENCYNKILAGEAADASDYLNAGHCAMASDNFKNALKYYKTFVDLSDNKEITNLLLAFKEDASTLKDLKISTSDLRLIVDKIRYDFLEEKSGF
ncbi:MAG: tetratricopeptide repeat protein [Muribaculaceae bacterium]|nr:tetratricopeptide repeat protein [Muribaculaceae bacterium]